MKYLLILSLFVLNCLVAFGQNNARYGKFNSYYYSQNDFKSGAQVWSGAQGNDGSVYFGNNNFILQFNGIDWKLIQCDTLNTSVKEIQKVQNTKVSKIFKASDGKIYAGRYDNFGEIRYSAKGETVYYPLHVSKMEHSLGQVWNIFEGDGLIYFIGENAVFTVKNGHVSKVKILDNSEYSCKIAGKVEEGFLMIYKKSSSDDEQNKYLFYNTKLKKSFSIKLPNYIHHLSIGGIIKLDGKYFLFNLNGEVYSFKIRNNEFIWDKDKTERFSSIRERTVNAAKLHNSKIYICTEKRGVLVLNLNGEIERSFNLNDGMENLTGYDAFHDRENNLWICLDNGIHFFETSSPLTSYDKKDGLVETINCFDVINNKTYLGSANDIWTYNLIENRKTFSSTKVIKQQTFDLKTYATDFGKKTIAVASTGIFAVDLESNKTQLISDAYAWVTYQNPANKNEFFVGCETSLDKIKLINNKWTYETVLPNLNGDVRFISSFQGKLIFGVEKKGLFVYDIASQKYEKVNLGKNSKNNTNFVIEVFDNTVFVGMESGLYTLSKDFKKIIPFKALNNHFVGDKNILIHRLFTQDNNKLWMVIYNEENEKQFEHGYLEKINNKFRWTSWPFEQINLNKDGLSYDIKKVSKEEVWFASGSTIFSFNENSIKNVNNAFNLEVDKVEINGEIFLYNPKFATKLPELSYDLNSVKIFFHAASFKGMKEMKYRYKLDDYMDKWSDYTGLNFADFKKLQEGTYTLKIQGKNIYGFESEVYTYGFTVLPPWYRTWWAYIIYFIAFCFFIFLLIKFSIQRVKSQNIKLEETVSERTKEIAQQNKLLETQKAEITQKTKDVVDSIIYAKRIQDTILPTSRLPELFKEHFVFYQPKDIVSGDFYWARKKGENAIFSAIDCTGHGVPGALVSIVGNGSLLRCVNEHKLIEPAEILDKHRDIVVKSFDSKGLGDVKDGMDMSLCVLNTKTLILKYAGANNECLVIRKGELIELKPDKQPIGNYSNPFPFTQQEIQLETGDCVYQYTDGYVDQFGGEKGKKLKSRPFKNMLLEIAHLSMDEQKVKITNFFDTWKGDLEQIDDVCVFGIKV